MKTRFREDVTKQSRPLVVDRDRGSVKDVKLLGLVSQNGRRYLPEAVRKALPLYDGVKSYIDHPQPEESMRRFAAVFGRFRSPRFVEGDGVRADYYFNTAHPLAEAFIFWCERDPSLCGFSHNAEGDTDERGGEVVVTEIERVASVDLVADPATTRGLAEGVGHRVDPGYARFIEGLKKIEAQDEDADDDTDAGWNKFATANNIDPDIESDDDEDDADEDGIDAKYRDFLKVLSKSHKAEKASKGKPSADDDGDADYKSFIKTMADEDGEDALDDDDEPPAKTEARHVDPGYERFCAFIEADRDDD